MRKLVPFGVQTAAMGVPVYADGPRRKGVMIDEEARSLLSEALEVPAESCTVVSRDPLGSGSVTGCDVYGGPECNEPLRYYIDTSQLSVTAETGLVLRPEAHGDASPPEARIWLHPADPHLPALAPVAFHHAAEALLARLGYTVRGAPEFVGYRPGRRAVLRATITAGAPVWVKVVRPSRVERIVTAHEAAIAAGVPVPTLLGWAPEGLIFLENAHGTPAAEVDWTRAFSGGVDGFLDEIDALREQCATVRLPARPRRRGTAIIDRLDWYAAQADQVLTGEELRRAVGLLEDIRRARAEEEHAGETVTTGSPELPVVHGDLHFGQLFIAEGHISGVIDVDTLGPGHPAEDPAACIAHATISALMTEQRDTQGVAGESGSSGVGDRADRVWHFADAASARWGSAAVRTRFAAHMIGHAIAAHVNGPHGESGEASMRKTILDTGFRVLNGGTPRAA